MACCSHSFCLCTNDGDKVLTTFDPQDGSVVSAIALSGPQQGQDISDTVTADDLNKCAPDYEDLRTGLYCLVFADDRSTRITVDSTTPVGNLYDPGGLVWAGNPSGTIPGNDWPGVWASARGRWNVGTSTWGSSSVTMEIQVVRDGTIVITNGVHEMYAPPSGQYFPEFNMLLDASHGMTSGIGDGLVMSMRIVLTENNLAPGDSFELFHFDADGFTPQVAF